MPAVRNINSVDVARTVYNKVLNNKWVKKIVPDNPGDLAARLALISTVSKDAINCYYYTNQSLHNKKIPEDKRKFVAGIDLSNGILNVLWGITIGSIIENKSGLWFDKGFGHLFSEKTAKTLSDKGILKHAFEEIKDSLKGNGRLAKSGFKAMAVLVVTQVIGKRIFTPFIATPLAGIFKNQMEKQEIKKLAQGSSEQVEEDSTPVVDGSQAAFEASQTAPEIKQTIPEANKQVVDVLNTHSNLLSKFRAVG